MTFVHQLKFYFVFVQKTFIVLVNNFSGFLLLTFIKLYKTGKTIRVKNKEEISPPIITVAKGFCTSAPEPVERAIGKKPKDATRAVIRTGLNLVAVPVLMVSLTDKLCSLSLLKVVIKTSPFRIATPKSAIKPIMAGTLIYIPLIHKAIIPPTAAKGMFIITSNASPTEENVATRSKNIINMETGTTTANFAIALC